MSSPIWCAPTAYCVEQMRGQVQRFSGIWPRSFVYMQRSMAEGEPAFQQIIPYVLLRRKGLIWCYRRCGGDARLLDRRSCGVGGHVEFEDERKDPLRTARAGALRELREELALAFDEPQLEPKSWIHERESEVGRVHLGLVMEVECPEEQEPQIAEPDKLQALGWLSPEAIAGDLRFELWSRLALQTPT